MIPLDGVPLFLHLLNLVLQHLYVQFELLLNLDVVAHLELILLELLLILFGRQV